MRPIATASAYRSSSACAGTRRGNSLRHRRTREELPCVPARVPLELFYLPRQLRGQVMHKLDTIIRGGRIATASDTVACDVGIRGGKIVALGEDLATAEEVIDARGRLVLPGGIDSHVHFSQPCGPDIVMADDFESGTRAAAFGGNTLVMPFCMQQKGESLRQVVKDYHAKADGKCYVDVSFHLIISDP